MRLARVLGLVLLVANGGCLGRSLPVPPPAVSAVRVEPCEAAQCPDGGVVVTVEGSAQANALVILEDTNRALPDGQFLGAVTRAATATGAFRLVVLPQRVAGGRVVAVQPGDALALYQVTTGTDGELSNTLTINVPRP